MLASPFDRVACGECRDVQNLLRYAWPAGFFCAGTAIWPALAAEATSLSAPVPTFSSNGVSWAGFVVPAVPSCRIGADVQRFFRCGQWAWPVTDDPAHPYINNEWQERQNSSQPIGSQTSTIPILKPWVVEVR